MDYKKIYNSIITKARSENRIRNKEVYYEAHEVAGVVMREYGKIQPLIYESKNKVTKYGKGIKSKKRVL